MSDLAIVIKNIYLRLLVGGVSTLMGLVFLKVHSDRHKENLWGQIYRFGREGKIENQAPFIADKIYLIIGLLATIGGLIALCYGFRFTMVGR